MSSSDKAHQVVRSLKAASVLVLEDHNFVQDLLERMLRDHVGALHGAQRAEDALYNLEQNPKLADVAIVDYKLPGMSGVRFIEKVRASKSKILRELPIIMLTSSNDMDIYRAAARFGISAFLIKPVGPATLIEALEGALNGRKVAAPLLNADPEPPSGREAEFPPEPEEAAMSARKGPRAPAQPQSFDFKT